MDVNIETEVATAVLNGLPPKYDHLIVALDALGDDTKLTLEFTESHLLQEKQRKTERSVRRETVAKSGHAAAQIRNSKQRRLGGSSEVHAEYTCYRCNKEGHIARYCRSKLNSGQDGGRKLSRMEWQKDSTGHCLILLARNTWIVKNRGGLKQSQRNATSKTVSSRLAFPTILLHMKYGLAGSRNVALTCLSAQSAGM
jgi:Zinc knuckle